MLKKLLILLSLSLVAAEHRDRDLHPYVKDDLIKFTLQVYQELKSREERYYGFSSVNDDFRSLQYVFRNTNDNDEIELHCVKLAASAFLMQHLHHRPSIVMNGR